MSLLYGSTEIGFPARPSGAGPQAMWDIGKDRRRRGRAGKPTAGGLSSPLGVALEARLWRNALEARLWRDGPRFR